MAFFSCRPARLQDAAQIHGIFRYYVTSTVTSLYTNPPSLATIEAKMQTSMTRGLPYIVAVEVGTSNSSKPSPSFLSSSQPANEGDILGYAYASPFRAPLLGYSPSVEISIFVRHESRHRGIGRALMVALLGQLKVTEHRAFEPGYELQSDKVVVRNVIAIVAHDGNGPDAGESGARLIGWYERFGFEVVGRLKQLGWKGDRWIDTVYLQLVLAGPE